MTPMGILAQEKTEQRIWYGCYDGGWGNNISPASYAHPAKMARGLAQRIYAYMLEQDWLKPGDTVLDPFGGIGGTCLDALTNGLNWVGVELEVRFTDLGQGCDCTGISKADWVRFYGRWDKVAHKDGRHFCPDCLAQAKQVTESRQLSFFEPEPTAAYIRNSGVIPETLPHRYRGNLDLFKRYAKPGTFAVLLNGDSRYLRRVIAQAQVDGVLSSPPYINSVNQSAGANDTEARIERMRQAGIDVANRANVGGGNGVARQPQNYGATSGQLGGMSEGNLADAVLSSPPYVNVDPAKNGSGINIQKQYETYRASGGGSSFEAFCQQQARHSQGYGASEGQLSGLPSGSLADALLTSPPFAGNTGGRGEASRNGIDAALFDRHSGGMKRGTGESPDNLDHLPMKGLAEALLSSPPFEKSLGFQDKTFEKIDRRPGRQGTKWERKITGEVNYGQDYGQTAGQLGIEQGQTFWSAARQIVTESYLALKPGAYSAWVCKKFVRDGAIVDFPAQWQQLCESIGFEYVETIRAMLVSPEAQQGDLDGGAKKIQKSRKSFFRRLSERNGSPAIDFEEVVILRKPL
jgi:hypothetical protein